MFVDLFTPYIKGREAAITANWNDRAKYNDVLQGILKNRQGVMDLDVRQAEQPGRMEVAGLQSENAADLFRRQMEEQRRVWDYNAWLDELHRNNPFGPNYSQEGGQWVHRGTGQGHAGGPGLGSGGQAATEATMTPPPSAPDSQTVTALGRAWDATNSPAATNAAIAMGSAIPGARWIYDNMPDFFDFVKQLFAPREGGQDMRYAPNPFLRRPQPIVTQPQPNIPSDPFARPY